MWQVASYLERLMTAGRRPTPDFSQLLTVLARKRPERPTLFEFFLNDPLYRRLSDFNDMQIQGGSHEYRRMIMRAFCRAGYDYFTALAPNFWFKAGDHDKESTISLNEGAVITDRASLENYPWPDPEKVDLAALARNAAELPDGMKIIVNGPGGVLENVIRLVGYDKLCYMLIDDPELAKAIFDGVGSRLARYYELVAAAGDFVGACISNDDWGFKTQPMLSPADLRTYVFPWHTKISAAIHAAGKPAILHSCGNAAEIWGDIIDGMRYDGKHSYEDNIEPVEDAYEKYAGRVALLGGLDVDFVIRSEPDAVYRRARAMLERSAARGCYALGTGNSVPNYVPDENYAAMVWAAIEARQG